MGKPQLRQNRETKSHGNKLLSAVSDIRYPHWKCKLSSSKMSPCQRRGGTRLKYHEEKKKNHEDLSPSFSGFLWWLSFWLLKIIIYFSEFLKVYSNMLFCFTKLLVFLERDASWRSLPDCVFWYPPILYILTCIFNLTKSERFHFSLRNIRILECFHSNHIPTNLL